MGKIKVAAFSVSLDGFGAGQDQGLENPLGVGGEELHTWIVTTKMFHRMTRKEGGTEGVDNDFAEKSMENIGAWIMGRNMFGPVRGPWPDNEWKGWWGEEPPYHVPVFVLTHHAREPLKMKGGTTFHFITGGIESALEEAKKVANGKDIRIGGGVSTIRQFLQAGYINEMHLVFSPIFLGSGEQLFSGIDMSALGFNQVQKINGEKATHIIATKS
ncbi:dihydrofolate reductase family protein [Flavitalea sp. BT771]|uniref:dihydrofolate reductase family protein n=1 Tax=Flavitalea sp. BT771 TaxID=3063329 RepID=UPI0026E3DC91|nr:dihydrofolate reductase family protein [Flavitalea sp. BT771]MDO6432635.1 dihydrofolate reductase family protein [Flavitalea sp. BT771]MDV6222089.1 dihydrofolate reductase family protein [Flavitalea sp. BT771]